MNKNEIKKALYKQNPEARIKFIRNNIRKKIRQGSN